MNYFSQSIAHLLGRKTRRPSPEEISPAAQKVHFYKKNEKFTKADLEAARASHANKSTKWRNRRWATLLVVNLLFVLSYFLDVQLLEGALTASRFVGFHMADLNSALQVTLAFKHMVLNLVIGTVTILILWILLGGRSFCSWVCPYHLLAEWAESVHLWLVKKKLVKSQDFDRRVRTFFYVVFTLLALLTGYTVFETLSPVGIVNRALIYGPGLSLLWVLALLLFEVFVSRRAWCRYVCPIGITYGLVGVISPLRVTYNFDNCHHEGDCRKVCLVPHVLDVTVKGRSYDVNVDLSADCTRCGLCIDVCPTDSLKFEFKGLSKVL